MVGAALSREFIAHECAPAEISNMFGWRLRKKFICCVALHPQSLRRTSKYASFLRICTPCIWNFLLCRL